jgi:L-asparaginase
VTATITVLFLGGTISMSGRDGGAVARLGADELLASVPALAGLPVTLDARDVRRMPSAGLTFDDVFAVLDEAERASSDGVVVVQGTDTIEETAYLADLLWHGDAPLVFTGAMRNPGLAGADGPANLLAAVTVAASSRFRGLGALVVLNDEVHAARHVRKLHSASPSAFASPNAGPLGRVNEGVAVLGARVPDRNVVSRPPAMTVRVPLVVTVFDDDAALLDGLGERCDGLVIAGFGVGHVRAALADVLGELARRIPIVLASRTGAGSVFTHTYGAPGSETDLVSRGLVPAGSLDPYKARILLAVLLANGLDRAAIAQEFARRSG